MAIVQTNQSDIHWNYFLALEKDLETSSRYIEFCAANYKTFSIELAHLLFAAASEVDVLAKMLCDLLEPGSNAGKITEYQKIIMKHLPKFADEEVFVPRYCLQFKPWENWLPTKSPIWWTSYNHVKHNRNNSFHKATLENARRAMGGLLVMLFFTQRQTLINRGDQIRRPCDVTRTLAPDSTLIRLNERYYVILISGGTAFDG